MQKWILHAWNSKLMAWLRQPLSFPRHWLLWPFLGIGMLMTAGSYGVITLDWMYVYSIEEFHSLGDVWGFLSELRTGISPVWSVVEIFLYWAGGNLDLPSQGLYRGGMIFAFALSFMLFPRSNGRFIGSFLLALLFLWGTVIIHPGNPQVYDIYLPLLILLFVLSLDRARRPGQGRKVQVAWLLCAGFMLSMAELTRPFVFPLLLVLLPLVWFSLRRMPRRSFAVFLLPLILFSGIWHLKMVIAHGQLNWTNHSGYNLHRCWQDFAGFPEMEVEAPPRSEKLSPNINTEAHTQNSRILSRHTMIGIVRHPWGAVKHVASRTVRFFRPQTELMRHHPDHFLLPLYQWGVRLCCLWMFLQGFLLLRHLLPRIRNLEKWLVVARPENILLIFALLNCFIYVVGEAGEDARFMISVLPFLAAFPGSMPLFWKNDPTRKRGQRKNSED